MFYAFLLYVVITVVLFLLYKNFSSLKRLEKLAIYHQAFVEQNERHLKVMEQQVEVSEKEAAAGKMMVDQMAMMNAKLDLLHEDSMVKMNLLRQDSAELQEEMMLLKSIILQDGRPEDTNLDFGVVQNMNHEVIVVEESEVESR